VAAAAVTLTLRTGLDEPPDVSRQGSEAVGAGDPADLLVVRADVGNEGGVPEVEGGMTEDDGARLRGADVEAGDHDETPQLREQVRVLELEGLKIGVVEHRDGHRLPRHEAAIHALDERHDLQLPVSEVGPLPGVRRHAEEALHNLSSPALVPLTGALESDAIQRREGPQIPPDELVEPGTCLRAAQLGAERLSAGQGELFGHIRSSSPGTETRGEVGAQGSRHGPALALHSASMDWRARIEATPRLGWVETPSPVERYEAQGIALGLPDLWIKRDDALGLAVGLPGGTKVRKLDVLLATPPWRDAPAWASVGAIGSGQLVALSAAARHLGRELDAHLFWEPPLPELLENLAYIASGPGRLRFVKTRVGLALRHPGVLTSRMLGQVAVVPPGATALAGELGVVRGALELADQIRAGLCPPPRHVFVPLGSGGTTAGLLAGFALTGLDCTVHAVATVERIYSLERPLRSRAQALLAHLGAAGRPLPRLTIHRDQLGKAYGVATPASLAACAAWASTGVGLEPIYSGKAMAALVSTAATLDGPVLFWATSRRPGPLPAAPDWVYRLPPALRRRFGPAGQPGFTRRRALVAAGALATTVGLWRFSGYPAAPVGVRFLPDWAAAVLEAACPAVLASDLSPEDRSDIVRRIDAFVATQPLEIRVQVQGALALVEQGGGLLTADVRRFSHLAVEDRVAVLTALAARGGLVAEAGRAVRDLVVLGHFQRPESWAALGYAGPWVSETPRPDAYGALVSDEPPPGFEV